ncbi:MAG: N-acetylmuramoyl-L-alanine amidase [Thermoflexales bacterium]|nr:N-acetylmuramoyl-L-alanine amidase [Thermoflexales bacterium]
MKACPAELVLTASLLAAALAVSALAASTPGTAAVSSLPGTVQPDGTARARAYVLLEAMLAESAQAGRAGEPGLPAGAGLYEVALDGSTALVRLELPACFLYASQLLQECDEAYEHLDPARSDALVRQLGTTLEPLHVLTLTVQARGQDGAFYPLSHFLFEPPAPRKEPEEIRVSNFEFQNSSGSLAGKAVYLSAGHGWYWSQFNTWRTQRLTYPKIDGYKGIVEDLNNAEAVNQYVIQYLRNAGADVWPVREHDMNTEQIVITLDSPSYSEQGAWATDDSTGYAGSPPRYAVTAAGANATATWSFTPAASGYYAVYAWYTSGSDRPPDAYYLVTHAGDTSPSRIDQTVHGYTWRYIGTYPFAAGRPALVQLTNQSSVSDRRVIAGAIRVGGGMGSLCGDTPAGCYATSQRPRWEEAARYWARYQGAPSSVYNPPACDQTADDYCDDITARPLYAEWEKPAGEDAVYVSWHSNGYDGDTRGTQSYIYSGAFTPGSDKLQNSLHDRLVHDIQAGWDPDWTDAGKRRADLGELRRLSSMPGVLLEIAFHDQADDTDALKDPRFEQLAARAVYKGIVSYFAARDGQAAVFSPEPPQAVSMRNVAPGTLRLDWLPSPTDSAGLLGHAATSYRVYLSSDGLGWRNAIAVDGTVYTLTQLAPGQLLFARVAGVNAGGESFPSPVVGARVGWPPPVLIVDGFGRIDRDGLVAQDDGYPLYTHYRMFVDRINSFDYIVRHGTALSLPFDSAQRRALGTLPVALGDYRIVDWIAGEEQSSSASIPPAAPGAALSAAEQAALQSFAGGGGALFISGAELGYDLVSQGQGVDFYAATLHAALGGDDAGSYTAAPASGGIFDGLSSLDFDPASGAGGPVGSYDVERPDYFTLLGEALPALSYIGGQGSTAALQYDSGGCWRLVYMGFPFETIRDASARQAVMGRVMDFLGTCIERRPDTTIQAPRDGRHYNATPLLEGTASDTGSLAVVRLQISSGLAYWDGTTWQPVPAWVDAAGTEMWQYALPILADGHYTVAAQAWNSIGFSDTTPAQVAFVVDTVSPTAPSPITPTGGITTGGVGMIFAYTASSDATGVAGYMVRIDDGWLLMTSDGVTASLVGALPDGEHTWTVEAFDRARNISPPSAPASFVAVSQHVYLPLILNRIEFLKP